MFEFNNFLILKNSIKFKINLLYQYKNDCGSYRVFLIAPFLTNSLKLIPIINFKVENVKNYTFAFCIYYYYLIILTFYLIILIQIIIIQFTCMIFYTLGNNTDNSYSKTNCHIN